MGCLCNLYHIITNHVGQLVFVVSLHLFVCLVSLSFALSTVVEAKGAAAVEERA
jgi:hypothetical protein